MWKLNNISLKSQIALLNLDDDDDDDDDDVDINMAYKSIRENRKASAKEWLGYYELKQHKPYFD